MTNGTARAFGHPSLPLRFWEKVDRSDDGCWRWTGCTHQGYGQYWHEEKTHRAHRVAYLELVGDIQPPLVLDHLCRVRNCVNPAHLEVVTNRTNILRGVSPSARHSRVTHCPQGHEYSPDNTLIRKGSIRSGQRMCRTCGRQKNRARRAAAKRA